MKGLVLEGGGAKGAFHAGAVKALYENGYKFDGIAGTSIGALNGAMLAQDDFEKCYKLWEQIKPSTLLDIDDQLFEKIMDGEFQKEDLPFALNFAKDVIANKGVSILKLEKLVDDYIDEVKLRESPIDYALVTVNITERWKPMELFKEEIPFGMLNKFILASAYYPAFNRPKIQGKSFIDGGMFNNCPINLLSRKGYNHLIGIRTLSKMPSQNIIDKNIKIDYILPSESLGRALDLRSSKIVYNLSLGYFDTIRYIKNLFGNKLYFSVFNEEYLLSLFNSIDNETIKDFSGIIHSDTPNALLNYFVEEGKKTFKISPLLSKENSFVYILENVIDLKNIEKFKIYDLREFISDLSINESVTKSETKAFKYLKVLKTLQQCLNS